MRKTTVFQKLANFVPKTAYELTVDTSHCPLKCPMCPRGGVNGLKNPDTGTMEFDLFKSIINKFSDEKVRIKELTFGNWGEPLLNDDLPKMIRYVKSHPTAMKPKSLIRINTTFNRLPAPLELLNCGVDIIVVSCSGMTQEIYSKNHKGGNIEKVLYNLDEFTRLRDSRNNKKIKLRLVFHDYVYNKDEAKLASKFCQEHNIRFSLHSPYLSSVGDAMSFARNQESLTEHYSKFIDVDKTMSIMKTMDHKKIKECRLRKNRVGVDFNGQLYRCDGVFEAKHLMGSIFDFKIKDIPNIDSDICRKCADTPISWRP